MKRTALFFLIIFLFLSFDVSAGNRFADVMNMPVQGLTLGMDLETVKDRFPDIKLLETNVMPAGKFRETAKEHSAPFLHGTTDFLEIFFTTQTGNKIWKLISIRELEPGENGNDILDAAVTHFGPDFFLYETYNKHSGILTYESQEKPGQNLILKANSNPEDDESLRVLRIDLEDFILRREDEALYREKTKRENYERYKNKF